ncbi:hypothetical protein [Glaciecola sp.]|jgi:hypothetical protein|uniref:hypothetical protein n=1 Tax=Glaciecola sp. MF2-115 TaxID=3384827 RepID=UPI00398A2D2D
MEMHPDEDRFLNELCDTLIAGKFESSNTYFHLPCVVIYNQHKFVFNNDKELQLWLSNYCKKLHLESRENLKFTLNKTVTMSSTVKFSKVNLLGLGLLENMKKLDITFTLSNDVDETLKIVVVVIDVI